MATTSQDNIQLRVIIDGSPARKELAQVNQDLVKLKETQKQLVDEQRQLNEARKAARANGDTAEVQRLNKVMEQNRQKLTELNQAVSQHNQKQTQLRQQIGDTALSFSELRGKAMGLQQALNRAVPNSPEAQKLAAELFTLQQRMKEVGGQAGIQAQAWEHLRRGLKLTDMSMRQLKMESERLKTALEKTKPDTPEFTRLHGELGRVDARVKQLSTGLGPFGQAWASVKGQIMGATAVLGTFFAGGAIVNMVGGIVKSSAELSDAIADVRRTTGLTTEQVQNMVGEFKKLDTRTPRAELMALAADAGKLGISAEQDVMAFVRAGDQLRVALGDELGGDAIKNIGKLVDLFRLKEQFGLEQSMLKVGSTLNELGMSSTAAEGYMVEFLKRMGGIAPLAGITIDQTLALGATLDSLGQTSEVSSTALSKMFIKMASEADQYARLAGMSTEQFREVMGKNALDAFIAVLEGSKKTEGGIIALAETLGEMGVEGSRAAGVFGALANNTDILAKQLLISKAAFEEGTSVTDEFRIKNETLAAVLAKMKKEIQQTFVTTGLVDTVKEWIARFRELMDWIRRNGEVFRAFGRVLLTVGTALAGYKASVLATSLVTRGAMAATTAWTTLKSLLTGQITRATAAQQAFNTVTKLNPIGLLVAGLAAAISLLDRYSAAAKAAADAAASETTKLQILHSQILATNKGTDERRKLVDQLKAQYPEYLGHLDSDKVSNEELARSISEVNKMLINKAVLQAADTGLEEQNAKAAKAKLQQVQAERRLQELIALGYKQTGLAVKEGTLAQQAFYIQSLGLQKGLSSSVYNEMDGALRKVRSWESEFQRESDKSNQLLGERQALMKSLGLATDETGTQTAKAARTLQQVSAEINEIQAKLADPGDASQFTVQFLKHSLAQLKAEQAALVGAAEGNAITARTLAVINEEIKRWQEQQTATSTTREEYLEIQRKIDALEKEKRAIEGAQGARQKAANDLSAVEKAMADFHERMYQLTLSEDERELRQLDVKHQEELAKLQEHQAKLIAAGKLSAPVAATNVQTLQTAQLDEYFKALSAQEERRFNAAYEVQQRIKQMISESQSQELRDTVAHYDRLIESAQIKAQSTVQLERERADAVMRFRERELQDALAAELRKWDELIALARSKGVDTTALENARGKAETALRRKWLDAQVHDTEDAEQRMRNARVQSLRHFEQIAGAFGGLVQSITAYMDAGVRAAESRADADGERTDAEIANINRLKQERRQAALLAIAVQGAAAIANGVASAMAAPNWVVGVAQALSTAGIVIGLMAQARALLAEADAGSSGANNTGQRPSLNNIPLGDSGMQAKGTKVLRAKDGGGVLGGSYHGEGHANLLIDSNTGRPLAEVERDELMLILSRKATAANADLIPMMLEASRTGQRMPLMDRHVEMPNPNRVGQAMRVVHMEGGGSWNSTRGTAVINYGTEPDSGINSGLEVLFTQLLTEMRGVRKAAERFPTKLNATTSLIEGERRKEEWDYMKNLNKGRRA